MVSFNLPTRGPLFATALLLCVLPALAQCWNRGQALVSASEKTAETVTIFPVFEVPFVTAEHPKGSEDQLGNRLGRDFIVMKFQTQEVPFPHAYQNDGKKNEDWYGWREEVLAPFEATVTDVRTGALSHAPGHLDRDQVANAITFTRDDGLNVVYAHVREVQVTEGDSVQAGDVVARVGNNGTSLMPHLHVGAWREGQPYQIQVDLSAMGQFISYGPTQ